MWSVPETKHTGGEPLPWVRQLTRLVIKIIFIENVFMWAKQNTFQNDARRGMSVIPEHTNHKNIAIRNLVGILMLSRNNIKRLMSVLVLFNYSLIFSIWVFKAHFVTGWLIFSHSTNSLSENLYVSKFTIL